MRLVAFISLPLLALITAGGCSSSSDSASPNPTGDGGSSGSSGGPGDGGGEGGAEGGGGEGGSDGGLAYVDYAINHILTTGQSNSVANGGVPPLTTSAGPYTNLSFDTGVMPMKMCTMSTAGDDGCQAYDTPASFIPIKEGDTYYYAVETASSSFANAISKAALGTYGFGTTPGLPAQHNTLVSVHGRSGFTYWCLRKNPCNYKPLDLNAYQQGMMEVQSAKTIAASMNLSYNVRVVTSVHGESDNEAYTEGHPEFPLDGSDGTSQSIKNYTDALLEWQRDYDTGIKAITNQTNDVPLLITQLSGWTTGATAVLPQMQLDAHTTSAGKVQIVTPEYMFTVASDCLHFDSPSQRWMGEYFAKAYTKNVFEGKPWEPLRPISITHAGAVITVKFLVPKPPIVVDTTLVKAATNDGFDVLDASMNILTVASVAVTAADTVTITLAAPPTTALTLRYAQNGTLNGCIGPGTQTTSPQSSPGPRGNIHDSDTTPSQFGNDLSNWLVSFTMPVN